ncbi:hypothetical protein SDC9_76813 [bioreactor metagenome]|uniref:Integrase catalytic domain-containing protein n=1 Tax=bioreactor metagenome TaxID=1076179 RepID=A0A644YNU1_9ZZZZ
MGNTKSLFQMKHTYHTNLAIAFNLGILPKEICCTVPASTRHNWKTRGYNHLFGLDYALDIQESTDVLRTIAQNKRLLRIARALVIIAGMYRRLLLQASDRKQILLAHKNEILNTIEQLVPLTGLKRALTPFDLSPQLYHYWKRSVSCVHAPIFRCRKIFYNQLTPKEVYLIRDYLLHSDFLRWPLASVYYRMIRDRAAFMSRSTFYLYARMLGLSGLHRFRKPKKRKKGIRALRPFEILHVDVTEVRLNDVQKLYISFIIDNFSRSILGWKAGFNKSASLTLNNLREVIERYNLKDFTLLSDDGSENKGLVADFIAGYKYRINPVIAQIDTSFSNSVVEAVFKIFKSNYWPRDFAGQVNKALEIISEMVHDYNDIRPHGSLTGLTPIEALMNENTDSIVPTDQIRIAATARITENLNSNCTNCQPKSE